MIDYIKRHEMLCQFQLELEEKGFQWTIGIDEVGRGSIAGPVSTAAVCLDRGEALFDSEFIGIFDSKKVSEKKRENLCKVIENKGKAVSFISISNEIIDEINIKNATKMAMAKSLEQVLHKLAALNKRETLEREEKVKIAVIIDNEQLDLEAYKGFPFEITQFAFPKADENHIAVAAASILAKVSRDQLMRKLDEVYPGYELCQNKGYGTKKHYEGIKSLGLSPIHRKTFCKG